MKTLIFTQTNTDKGGTNQYENRYDEAEEIKSLNYDKYYFGTSIEEQIHGLRNVLRCHFIKESCAPRKYYQFKKEWLQKEKDNFSKEVLIWIR